jgi:oligopeptide transport system substrate-binding protein
LGPFTLETWVAQSHLTLTKNHRYHGSPAHLDGIDIRIIPHATTRIQLFLEKETDLVESVPREFVPQLWSNPGLVAAPTNTWVGLVFNTSRRPFTQLKARQAFQQSINRQEFRSLLKWQELPTPDLLSFLPAANGVTPDLGAKFSPESALSLLQDIHWQGDALRFEENEVLRNFPKPTLAFHAGDKGQETAENLQAQWLRALNFKVDLTEGSNPSAAMNILEIRSDPWTDPGGLKQFFSDGLANFARWRSADYDSLILNSALASTPATADGLLTQAEQLVAGQEAVVLPLHFKTRYVLKRPDIKSITETPIEIWDFRDTTVF